MTHAPDTHDTQATTSANSHVFFHRLPPEALIRTELRQTGTLAVRLIGPPGHGKTELLQATLSRLPTAGRVAVIVVNPAAQRDANRLAPFCGYVRFIEAAAPRAAQVWAAIQQLPLKDIDLILIETCGGLAVLEDLGQDATVALLAVSGGDDKAAEYHALLEKSAVVLLNKCDMKSAVRFDHRVFEDDVRAASPGAEYYETSAVTGHGLHAWLQWLNRAQEAKKHINSIPATDPLTETFLG